MPGGAFYLGDGLTVDPITRTVSAGGGGGGSVPKPLTYDYMPEGYPTKAVETETLIEEQTASFSAVEGLMVSVLAIDPDPTDGQKLTVWWDGAEYNVTVTLIRNTYAAFGNLGMAGFGETTDEPFMYIDQGMGAEFWFTADTAESHTIKVIGKKETYKTIDENFLPKAKYVSYEAQDLTDEEKASARNNVNALGKDVLIEIPTNIVLASDYEKYYEKYKETGLPIKWDGHIVTYIVNNGSTEGLKSYIFNDGRRLYYINEYVYNGEKRLAYSSYKNFSDNIQVNTINFTAAEASKRISLNSLGDLLTNDGGKIMIWNGGVVVNSSTANSTKKFKITVDDSGTISATEVTA